MTAISPKTDPIFLPIDTAAYLKIRQYRKDPFDIHDVYKREFDIHVVYQHEDDDMQVEVHLELNAQATADFIKRFFVNPNLRFSVLGPNGLSLDPMSEKKPEAIRFKFKPVRYPVCSFFQSAIAPLFFPDREWLISAIQVEKEEQFFTIHPIAQDNPEGQQPERSLALQKMMDRVDSMAIEEITGLTLTIPPYIQPLKSRAIFKVGSDETIQERFLHPDGTHVLDHPSTSISLDIAIQGFLNEKLLENRFFFAVKDHLKALQAKKDAKAFYELLFKLNKPPCLIQIFDLISSKRPFVVSQKKIDLNRISEIFDCFKAFLGGNKFQDFTWLEKEDLDTVLYCAKKFLKVLESKKWRTLFLKLMSRLVTLNSIRSIFFTLVSVKK